MYNSYRIKSSNINPNITCSKSFNPNSLNEQKKTYTQFSINSEFRTKTYSSFNDNKSNIQESSSSTNFIIELPEIMYNVIGLELVQAELPSVVYTFSESLGNSSFQITLENSNTNESYTHIIKITDGIWYQSKLVEFMEVNYFNYNGSENNLLKFLKFDIDSASLKTKIRFKTIEEYNNEFLSLTLIEYNLIIDHLVYYIEPTDAENLIGNKKFKTNLGVYCNKNYNFENDEIKSLSNTALEILGFVIEDLYEIEIIEKKVKVCKNNYKCEREINYYIKKFSKINTTKIGFINYFGILNSTNLYGHNTETSYYISVNDFLSNQNEQITLVGNKSTISANNIMAKVQLLASPGQDNFFDAMINFSIKRNYYGNVKLRKLQIQVLDKYGKIVDLHNYPTNFVFELTIAYNSENQCKFSKEFQDDMNLLNVN